MKGNRSFPKAKQLIDGCGASLSVVQVTQRAWQDEGDAEYTRAVILTNSPLGDHFTNCKCFMPLSIEADCRCDVASHM